MHSEPLSKHISKCLLTLNALFFVAYASADIDISERNGGRVVALEVNDASRAEVLEALAERFDISVGGEATHWSDVPIELSVSGDLETVLNALLQDTSAVYGYFTSRSGDTRINSVTLLNRGKGGFAASPAPATPTPAARQVREIGTGLRDRNGVEQTVVLDPGLTAGVSSGDSPSRLSSSLERRAPHDRWYADRSRCDSSDRRHPGRRRQGRHAGPYPAGAAGRAEPRRGIAAGRGTALRVIGAAR